MDDYKVKFEWYVLNECRYPSETKFNEYPFENGRIKPWNIFNNGYVYETTIKLCKDYKRKKMTFDEFKEELRKAIMFEEWSRCEYEIMVGSLFSREGDRPQKIDCYQQVLPNLDILARYVLTTYYPRLKLQIKETENESAI